MRFSALALAIAALIAYSSPPGSVRHIAFASLPGLIGLFLYARIKARPKEDFEDTPWDA